MNATIRDASLMPRTGFPSGPIVSTPLETSTAHGRMRRIASLKSRTAKHGSGSDNGGVRLNAYLARAGVASRRAAEVLVVEGRVRVNGRVVSELGAGADARKDRIEVDGKRIVAEKPVYIVLHKPRAMVSTLSDPEGRAHLGAILSHVQARVYPIGRLDFDTEGLLLLTNDGELAYRLMHPSFKVPKTYHARVAGIPSRHQMEALRSSCGDCTTSPARPRAFQSEPL